MTVGAPGPMISPLRPGIGATHAEWSVGSLKRAAGSFPIMTVPEPCMIIPGPPGTQGAMVQGAVVSVMRAAGMLAIMTVGSPLMIGSGMPGCGTGVGVGAGGCMGAWQCGVVWRTLSPMRAAGKGTVVS